MRDEDNFSPALKKARRLDADPSDEEFVPRDSVADASRPTRQRARHRVDVVVMLLERHDVEMWITQDEVASVHVFTDASPVTGIELQGQVLDSVLKKWRRPQAGAPWG